MIEEMKEKGDFTRIWNYGLATSISLSGFFDYTVVFDY